MDRPCTQEALPLISNLRRPTKLVWSLGITLTLLALLPPGKVKSDDKVNQQSGCTLATLTGTYVFTATGYNVVGSVPQPKAIVEVIDFDGKGTLNVPAATVSLNGNPILRSMNVGGSYTIPNQNFNNESCTGAITFNNGPAFDIFVVPNGKEFYMVQTNPNTVLAGVSRRVTPRPADHDQE